MTGPPQSWESPWQQRVQQRHFPSLMELMVQSVREAPPGWGDDVTFVPSGPEWKRTCCRLPVPCAITQELLLKKIMVHEGGWEMLQNKEKITAWKWFYIKIGCTVLAKYRKLGPWAQLGSHLENNSIAGWYEQMELRETEQAAREPTLSHRGRAADDPQPTLKWLGESN